VPPFSPGPDGIFISKLLRICLTDCAGSDTATQINTALKNKTFFIAERLKNKSTERKTFDDVKTESRTIP
jgi:hypothetical protein